MPTYAEQRAKQLLLLTRDVLKELPGVCAEFIQAIDATTQPMTRYAYVCDLKMFCEFLVAELPKFAGKSVELLDESDFDRVTARDIRTYLDYLGYYVKDESERTNAELGKMRKLSSLRSFYEFLFKNEYVQSDVSKLVDMPKRHDRPIIRLEIDEVARMLDAVESGKGLSERQRRYNEHTKLRDLAILTLFLGTGIRVSELVGLNIDDIDFSINGFLITRKGGNQAILYFPDEVADVLHRYLDARRQVEARAGDEGRAVPLPAEPAHFGARRAGDGQEIRPAGRAVEKAPQPAQTPIDIWHEPLSRDGRHLPRRRRVGPHRRQHHAPPLRRHVG